MKCEYCGFDSSEENIHAEGAPCGHKGCLHFTCCIKAWKQHMLLDHKIDVETDEYRNKHGCINCENRCQDPDGGFDCKDWRG